MGAPATDPFSAFAGSVGSGLGKGLGDALSGNGGGPFVGGASSAMAYGTTLDGAGWIVNVGGQQSATASPVRTTTNSPTYDPSSTGLPGEWGSSRAGLGTVPMLLLAGVFAAWVLKRAAK
jgi:hypothetical protein